ncbi:YvcK family protein [Candidatus Minimicrobia naudis]|uniref:YvcK family protein n=1 Tax=Candidatus Minimicrobia naudis TaxID=2841263 RepID=A0A8F1MBX5_9BACT|nr:YvcK family protein [Candidatus Minimicrobia naudis]
MALSTSPKVRDLFNYRFGEGSMKGHAFGNLFMAALEKMTGSFAEAVELASEVLGGAKTEFIRLLWTTQQCRLS